MHREALADLGASLRRDLGDLLDGGPAALAGLDEDARRWLGTMDSEMQALAAWLTSSSVWADLPVDAPPAPDSRESAPVPREGNAVLPESARVLKERAPVPPESNAVLPERARVLKERAPVPRESSAVLSESARVLKDRAPGLREESSRSSVGLRQSPAVTAVPWTSPPRSPSPIAHPSSGRGGSPPAQSLTDVRSRDLPLSRSAGGRWERGIEGVRSGGGALRPSGEVLPALESSPGPLEKALEARHRSDSASAPPEPTPLQPLMDFTPARSLHDLVRLLSSENGEAAPSPGPAAPARSEEARADDPATYPAATYPATFPAMFQAEEGRQTPPEGSNATDTAAVPPPPVSAAEVDVEPILDALARSVADEYKRFYGS